MVKKEHGFCVKINNEYFYFPLFKSKKTKLGDQYLIPNNPDGSHFSFHRSGDIHFKNMKTNQYIPITKKDIFEPTINSLKKISEDFKIIKEETNEKERKLIVEIIINIFKCLEKDCGIDNCEKSLFFNMDAFRNFMIELSKIDGVEYNNEDNSDFDEEDFNILFIRLMEDEGYIMDLDIKKCSKCGNEPMIRTIEDKNYVKECDHCGGYGIDLTSIEQYKCKDITSNKE